MIDYFQVNGSRNADLPMLPSIYYCFQRYPSYHWNLLLFGAHHRREDLNCVRKSHKLCQLLDNRILVEGTHQQRRPWSCWFVIKRIVVFMLQRKSCLVNNQMTLTLMLSVNVQSCFVPFCLRPWLLDIWFGKMCIPVLGVWWLVHTHSDVSSRAVTWSIHLFKLNRKRNGGMCKYVPQLLDLD